MADTSGANSVVKVLVAIFLIVVAVAFAASWPNFGAPVWANLLAIGVALVVIGALIGWLIKNFN